jgi:hypothetical protein
MQDLRQAGVLDGSATRGLRLPFIFDDALNVIGAWMKLYRLGRPALN